MKKSALGMKEPTVEQPASNGTTRPKNPPAPSAFGTSGQAAVQRFWWSSTHCIFYKRTTMAKKPGTNPKGEFVFFDVMYEDGSQRSNRRVPAGLLGGIDKDIPARSFIINQDREIADKSGRPAQPIKSLRRAGARNK